MRDYSDNLDQAVPVSSNEAPDRNQLQKYLYDHLPGFDGEWTLEQFPGGYSNLTFLLKTEDKAYVLRKPPNGADIKSAHDMGREYSVLKALQPVYKPVPAPILFCDDVTIIGAPFYLMERIQGIILRNKPPKGMDLSPDTMQAISEAAVDNLAALHAIDLESSGLISLGKPEGYVQRQVEGWIKRYRNAATEEISHMNTAAEWMQLNLPQEVTPSFIHNDYKYDNLVLDPSDLSQIKAVLDWEMATVGDPLMDLGTMLGYWAEASDSAALKPFNLTWLPGNLTREAVVERYAAQSKIAVPNILYYYVFGTFKIAVIAQQIYARYQKGWTTDQRFAGLIHVVRACAQNAQNAIQYNRISNFY